MLIVSASTVSTVNDSALDAVPNLVFRLEPWEELLKRLPNLGTIRVHVPTHGACAEWQ
jgi:hypothetical protein